MKRDMTTTEAQRPDIFVYTDFRKFLVDFYEFMKLQTSYFSYRYFSKLAGFASPNFYKLVADGKRNLSDDGIQRFSKALKLDAKEARHFRVLVHLAQAATSEERDFFANQLFKSKSLKALKPLSEAQYRYYNEWYHIPLRELVERSDFRNDPKWIAGQFTPPLSEKQVNEGLATLLKLELIEVNDCGGFRQTQRAITSGDDVTGQAFLNFQKQVIQLGAEAIERFPKEEREVSSLTLGVSAGSFQKIQKLIKDFQQEVIAIASVPQPVEEILQLNVQLFPLLKNKDQQ